MIEIGVREGILIAVILLAVYLLVTLLRLLRAQRPPAESEVPEAPQTLVVDEPEQTVSPKAAETVQAPEPQVDNSDTAKRAAAVNLDAYAASSSEAADEGEDFIGYASREAVPAFDLADLYQLETQQLRRDVAQLRGEQDQLRRELASLRRDMDEFQAAQGRLNYVRPESPQHSEAMVLAERGLPAIQIAERCGIAVAEAELVCALARREVVE